MYTCATPAASLCYTGLVTKPDTAIAPNRVGVRELRNQVAAVIRRAQSGDRIVVTADGVPVAQLTAIEPVGGLTLDDLIAGGLVRPPGRSTLPDRPRPTAVPIDVSAAVVLGEVRG